MRDYSNMPVLDWREKESLLKARFQVLHQEPVILQMPEGFNSQLSMDEVDCDLNEESGTLFNCNGAQTLKQLAEKNHMQELNELAEACHISSSQVDIDPAQNRIILHD